MTGLERAEKECERTDKNFDADFYFVLLDLIDIAKDYISIKDQFKDKCDCKDDGGRECVWCRLDMNANNLTAPLDSSTE